MSSTVVEWSIFIALLVIYVTWWVKKWRNPKSNGVLPPGSMGLPLIGETLSLVSPSYSLDLHQFIKKRLDRYGPIFKTSLAGSPVVISADPEVNKYIIKEEGKSVEMWYLDTFSNILVQDSDSKTSIGNGMVHKYMRSIALKHFGVETIKKTLLVEMEEIINKTAHSWSSQESIEVKRASTDMFFKYSAKKMISYDVENSTDNLGEKYARVIKGIMSFPLNIPGTAYSNCLKNKKKVTTILRNILKQRLSSPRIQGGDFLDQAANDLDKENFLSQDFCVQLAFTGLFASSESNSTTLALVLNFLADHPSVLEELTAEHEAIIKRRENPSSALTWDEYKSMTFTLQVIHETLRLGNISPGLFRRALQDIPAKGFTIPEGWTIMVVTSAFHLNPIIFPDPIKFNPSRWKDLDSQTISNNFMPFGGGTRQCAGADFTRVFVATFIHVLVTKYRWTTIKTACIARNPILVLGDGVHIKLSQKN